MRLHRVIALWIAATACCSGADCLAAFNVGLARVDITPSTAIRLSGYAARTTESAGVQQRLAAKALAIESNEQTCILITVDCTGLSAAITDRVKTAIQLKTGIEPKNIVLAASHTHAAPMIAGYLENLFGKSKYPVTAEQQKRIDRYTSELEKKLLQVATDSLENRSPAQLSWSLDKVEFAANRRTENGPVDHDLPVLKVSEPNGTTRALVVGYACHCTTLNHADNLVSGDWAGYAKEYIEQKFPTAEAMIVIGAAADSNPHPRGTLTDAQNHGRAIADGVERACRKDALKPIKPSITTSIATINLDFAKPDTTPLPYTIQTWVLGGELAMVFLQGEVVVDYSLALKKRHHDHPDLDCLWIGAFCNGVPGYIPSDRILTEGGYEADDSTFYYGLPGRFDPALEVNILKEVSRQLDRSLKAAGSSSD